MIHVWKLDTITLCNLVVVNSPLSFQAVTSLELRPLCNLVVVNSPLSFQAVTSLELRRRIHTSGRAAIESTICPTCYAAARPVKTPDKYASPYRRPMRGKP